MQTTTTATGWHQVEAQLCALDPELAKMETGEASAVAEAARTARRAAHALLDAMALAGIAAASRVEVDRFTAEHGRAPSYTVDPDDHSDVVF